MRILLDWRLCLYDFQCMGNVPEQTESIKVGTFMCILSKNLFSSQLCNIQKSSPCKFQTLGRLFIVSFIFKIARGTFANK